jgi:hypothetical protein
MIASIGNVLIRLFPQEIEMFNEKIGVGDKTWQISAAGSGLQSRPAEALVRDINDETDQIRGFLRCSSSSFSSSKFLFFRHRHRHRHRSRPEVQRLFDRSRIASIARPPGQGGKNPQEE